MEVIKAAYKHTAALLNYITALVGDQQIPPLMQDQDKQVYRHLLQTTVVGVNKEWTGKLTLQQVSNQSDVILRALQQIFHKEEQKGNILGIGFRKTYKSTEGLPVILTRRDIESNQPGVACSRFQSRPWQTLLNRVGDDIMMHLLLHTSLFMFVPPDCYVQITGIPIDNQQSAGKIKSASERRKKRRYGKAEEGIQGKKFKPSSAIQDVRRLRRKRCDSESGPSTKRQKVTLEAEIESGIDGNANIDEKAADDEDERSRQIIDGKKSKGMTSGVNQSVHVSGHQAASSNHKHTVDCEGSIQAMDANEKRKKEKRKRLKKEKTGIVDVPSKTEREEKFMKKQRTKRYKCRRKTKSKQNKMLFTINESEVLPREQLFYSKYSRESLPKSMPLNICSASNRGARKLLEMVFPEIKKKITKISNKKIQRTPKLLIRIKKIMVKLLKNHRRCRYDILLHHYCHIESLNKLSESGEDGGVKVYHRRAPNTDKVLPRKEQISGQSGAETFLSRYTDTVDVNRFVRAVGHRVVPTKLWGSNHNRQQFLKNVYQFLKLGRYEKFTLRQLVFGIKVSDCKWLAHSTTGHAGTQESLMKKTILYRVLRWLMIRVVMVVVKSMFYITESSVYRNHVFYYRKIIWNRCRSLGVQEYLNKGILKKVPSNEAKEKLKKMNKTSSNLRFLPKKSSLRPIVTMKGSSTMQARAKEVSLYGLLHVLSYIKNENPGQLGSSVLGFDDIYAKWKNYALWCRDKGDRKLYFLKLDIQNCFDTIKQNKLMKIMERVLAQLDTDSYTLRYYSVVGVHQESIFRHHKWSVSSLSDFQPDIIKHVSKERQKSRSYSNKVVIELNVNQVEKVGALLQKLQRHIQGNVVKIAGKFYFQITGIPQGSVLSTLLCSYFYGDMEQKFLTGIDEDGLLLRMVDDFLLVTPHISQAKKFLEIMSSGIPEYGCRINTKKTVANFALDRQDCTVTCLENLALFPWCGMLINTQTLEVYGDYSGYENLDMKDTITLDLTKNPGQSILNKLQHTIRLKCHALFVDHQVNSTATIITNLHRLFQLTASRLHCIAQQLPPHHRVADNPKYFNRLLLQLGQYTHNLASAAGTNTVETFPLSKPAVIWLCFRTFKTRLELHRPVYHSLLKLISVELQRNVEKVNPRTLKQLEAVLNMSGSVMSELL